MKNRIPSLLVALGLLGVVLYPRLSTGFPPAIRTDFLTGVAMGVFLGVEIAGVSMMRRRSRCRMAS
jgi:hypothetical protein